MSAPETIELERGIFAQNPIAWFETWGWIEGKEVGVLENNPEANWLQLQVGKAVKWCLKHKRKIQLILYKPRQQGCSTITIEILYVLGRCVKMKILVIGGQASQTDNLWKILRYYGDNDKFDWGNTWDLNETRAVCSNGTMWERETAGDPNAGRSGNYHAVIACVPGDTQVLGTNGKAKAIRDIVVGERIITHQGNTTEVAALRSMPNTKGDLYEVVPYIGSPEAFTFDHALWTKDGWVDAGNIKPGDFVSMPVRGITQHINSITLAPTPVRKQGGGRVRPFANSTIQLNEEFGFFVGYYLAEGCVCYSERKYPSKITFTHDDEDRDRNYADRAISAASQWTTSVYESRNGTSNAIHRELRCSALANWINVEFGSAKVGGKYIPDWVFDAGDSFCRGIVAGYLCGDGSKKGGSGANGRKYDRVNAKCVYPSILPQIRDIIASFGWGWAGIRYQRASARYGRNCRDLWQADWSGDTARILRGLMGLDRLEQNPRKTADRKYHIQDGMVWIKVKEVRRKVCAEVWDLGTSHVDGSFRTLNFSCHNTEVARWPTDGAKNAGDVLNSVLNCVGDGEGTCVIMESTAQGPKGPFPKTWAGAVTLEQAEKGEVGNGYIKIFAPWYVFPRCWSEFTEGDNPAKLAERLKKAGDDKAIRLWKELKLQPEQVKWYHEMLFSPECNGEVQKRDREHPTTEADGFSASSPSRFDLTALAEMDKHAASRANDIAYGNLTLKPHQPYRLCQFVPCDLKNASVAILEAPIPGESYIIATDNGRGESWTEGADTDPNAIVVWKRGRMTARGEWQHGEVVAALCPGNREDQPFLADHCARLSGYYGNCIVVPESNKGELLIEKLREKGVPIWGRERKAQDTKDTETQLLGWETTPETKHYAIENLATHMIKRNHVGTGIRIGLQWIIDEMRTFVRHKNGTLGALKLAGCHDDFVIALAIAVACESSATFMAPLAGQSFRPEGMPGDDSGHAGHW